MGKYTVRQADRVTDRQNDSMTVWQNSRAAKEPALVTFLTHTVRTSLQTFTKLVFRGTNIPKFSFNTRVHYPREKYFWAHEFYPRFTIY